MTQFAHILTLFVAAVHATPMPGALERMFATGKATELCCKEINLIVTVLKEHRATPLCSSYLEIPVVTSTTTVKTTSVTTVKITSIITAPAEATTITSTVTVPGLTSYVFRPGNPPTAQVQKRDQRIAKRIYKPEKPEYLKECDEIISSGCKCLNIPQKTVVVSESATILSTSTTKKTTTTTLLSASTATSTKTALASTTTLYPCATPIPALVQTVPYGDASSSLDLGLQNTLFTLSEPEGASAEACCNACYFGISNCVQAYFYSYEGCVVAQASKAGNGLGVSSSCPGGLFSGLTYARDTAPAFRSTGDFAGPCGVRYDNL